MTSTPLALVYAVYGDRASAEAAARMAVERRLAACANILPPCTSVYRWEGAVTQGEEVPVLFKTGTDRRDALVALLAENHGYDIPAILGWNVDAAHPAFGRWVAEETRQG